MFQLWTYIVVSAKVSVNRNCCTFINGGGGFTAVYVEHRGKGRGTNGEATHTQ